MQFVLDCFANLIAIISKDGVGKGIYGQYSYLNIALDATENLYLML